VKKIEIPIIKLNQSNWKMYIGVMRAGDLFSIAEVDRLRLESLEVPKYAGYQRALDQRRVNSIRDYLETPDCTFPNSIIITIDSDSIQNWHEIENVDEVSILTLNKEKGAVKIVDGQHRAAALDSAKEDFEVIVTIFVDLDIVKCAQIFAKINSTQKSVNPSIAFQLFGYGDKRSPQKTAHEIAEILNKTENSPFYQKLRMLGTKDDWSNGSLSQSTFSKQLMRLYTKSPEQDENNILKNLALENYKGYPLRECFINNNDKKILEIIWKYFRIIEKNWSDQWNDSTNQSILVKTTGFSSFIEVLRQYLIKKGETLDFIEVSTRFQEIRDKYIRNENKFIGDNYPAGHQGVKPLRDKLLSDLNLK
jgi:DGQHR domain-containing protein